ncbi:MAG: hypothetical protein BWY52_00678 [Chloroflexi bacterium ADurb.Bin325]|nr:MAG: hypothetical protein BWY52_00678 [Chloroflexi bacterium ADurb.Bin325]
MSATRRHNRLDAAVGPMILIFPEGSWVELLPAAALTCEDEESRGVEWELRRRIYYHEHFRDDTVVEREWVVPKVIHNTGWGLASKRIPATTERGAWKFDPILKDAADLAGLRYPEISYDEPATQRNLAAAQDLFGDILDVKLKGVSHISYHLMSQYSDWRGLEETMLDMRLQPGLLHEAMARLEEGHRGVLRQMVAQNLLSLNNDGTYHSSGGVGYTDELPAAGFDPAHVRPCDMWASAESQELAQVGPKQHAEFALAYEKRLLEPFGLTGYGCCEDLSRKLDDVLTIPHIRRISISPFADVDRAAEKLGDRAIFSWKPHPAHLVGDFAPDAIRGYIRHTVEVAQRHGCVLEMILKDTHTCEHRPERFDRWTEIAREEVGRVQH